MVFGRLNYPLQILSRFGFFGSKLVIIIKFYTYYEKKVFPICLLLIPICLSLVIKAF